MARSKRVSRNSAKRSINNGDSQNEAASVAPLEKEAESSRSARKRGRAKCVKIQTLNPNSRLHLDFNECFQPIGPNMAVFQSYLGFNARKCNLCPIDIFEWDAMPNSLKDTHFQLVESKFSYDIPREEMERVVSMSMAKKWRGHKHDLRKYVFDEKLSMEENFKKRPETVEDQIQWEKLIRFFMSHEGQERHLQGEKSRASQILLHNLGQKSFANKRFEMVEAEGEVGPLRFFEETHKTRSGCLNNVAATIADIVNNKVIEKLGNSDVSQEDRFNLEKEAFDDTFGPERPGRVRGFGFGATATLMNRSNKTSKAINSEIEELKRKLEEMEKKDKEKERQLEEIKRKFEDKGKQIEEMKQEEEEKKKRIEKMENAIEFFKQYFLSSQGSSATSVDRHVSSRQRSRGG